MSDETSFFYKVYCPSLETEFIATAKSDEFKEGDFVVCNVSMDEKAKITITDVLKVISRESAGPSDDVLIERLTSPGETKIFNQFESRDAELLDKIEKIVSIAPDVFKNVKILKAHQCFFNRVLITFNSFGKFDFFKLRQELQTKLCRKVVLRNLNFQPKENKIPTPITPNKAEPDSESKKESKKEKKSAKNFDTWKKEPPRKALIDIDKAQLRGKCGRKLCCLTFLKDSKMAKANKIGINQRDAWIQEQCRDKFTAIGCCGHFRCCFTFEKSYCDNLANKFPPYAKKIDVDGVKYTLEKINFCLETATIKRIENSNSEFPDKFDIKVGDVFKDTDGIWKLTDECKTLLKS